HLLRQEKVINAVAISPNGGSIATASDDRTAQIWRIPDGSPTARLPHQSQVNDVSFSPDGSTLATASEDGTAMLWDRATRRPIGIPMRHRARVRTIRYGPDGTKLFTLSDDRTVRLWDGSTAQPLSEPMRHPEAVDTVTFSPEGERLVVSSTTDSNLWLWKITARNAMRRSFAVSNPKRTAHLARQTGQLCIADGHALRICARIDPQVEPEKIDLGLPPDFFNLSADGAQAVVVSVNNVWIWDLASRQSVKGPLWHSTEIVSAEVSPDRRRLAVATVGGQLMVSHQVHAGGTPARQ